MSYANLDYIHELFKNQNYSNALYLLTQLSKNEDCNPKAIWYLGLAQLLIGNEEEARETWITGITQFDSDELIKILHTEAESLFSIEEFQKAWLIRCYLHEIQPNNLDNLILLVSLGVKAKFFTEWHFNQFQVIEKLEGYLGVSEISLAIIIDCFKTLITHPPILKVIPKLAVVSLKYFPKKEQRETLIECLIKTSHQLAYFYGLTDEGIDLLKNCRIYRPSDISLLHQIGFVYFKKNQYKEGQKYGEQALATSTSLIERIGSIYYLLCCIANSGDTFIEVKNYVYLQKQLLQDILGSQSTFSPRDVTQLFVSYFHSPYVVDSFLDTKVVQNLISSACDNSIRLYYHTTYHKLSNQNSQRKFNITPLKIGFLSNCFHRSSVGYLAQPLMKYINRSEYKLNLYSFLKKLDPDPIYQWYLNNSDKYYYHGEGTYEELAQVINDDEINILIDLDGLTSVVPAMIFPLRPAPIQITWLGWDATGLPSCDYFIADPYVLPDNAQEYYTETIWRLPNTYIAVDGFQIGIPDLRRDDLGIPDSAVVYLSSQKGDKRNPDNLRQQMRIIKGVKGSFFILKGFCDQEAFKEFAIKIANEEGVSESQLIFLPPSPTEIGHRANLYIADIVLDTYPYNGATTTLEVLWMNIPIVTRVGSQFFARYTYTMLKNIGVEEGIAWNDAEYVEWGIRFGTDHELREQVARKIRQSKHWAPLWNAKQFARDMENAFEQIWQKYLELRG
jgi:predicted O-linked N-acetylglucosamine transferase (SPINDLY family)